jgi:prepilin-type N-terminal cleavage/methylation domain-containing protein
MNKKFKQGFTLIELLVVTSIISLLSSVVLYSVSDARVKAQDTQKIQGVNQVALAMEIHREKIGSAPKGSTVSYNYGVAYPENSEQYQSAMAKLVESGSISSIPRSPSGQDYFYILEDDNTSVIGTTLDHGDNIDQNGGCAFSSDDYSCDEEDTTKIIIRRGSITDAAEECADPEGSCDGVAVEEGGGEVATEESCFTFSSGSITGYDEVNCPLNVTIPSTIGGENVTDIGWYAFYNNQLTSVSIPSGVTSIGSISFANKQLTSVSIPDTVTTIRGGAFQQNQLTSVSIPDSVTVIYNNAFEDNQLTSVSIPDSVILNGGNIFAENQLESVSIPSSLTSIDVAMYRLNKLTSVSIPEGVTSIANNVFQNNKLESVYIPDSVTSIGFGAFTGNNITSVSMKLGTEYDPYSFDDSCTEDNGCIQLR